MNFYDFMESCRADNLTPEEAIDEWERTVAKRHTMRIEEYNNDCCVQYGWYQQDMIDLRRRER